MTTKYTQIPLYDDLSAITNEQLAEIMSMGAALTKYFKDATEVGKERVNSGAELPGWEASPGKRSREWKSEAVAIAVMGKSGINDPYLHTLMSPAQAEKKLPESSHELLAEGWDWHPGTPSLKQKKGASATLKLFEGVIASKETGPDFGW